MGLQSQKVYKAKDFTLENSFDYIAIDKSAKRENQQINANKPELYPFPKILGSATASNTIDGNTVNNVIEGKLLHVIKIFQHISLKYV